MYKVHNSPKNRRNSRSKKKNIGTKEAPRLCVFRSNKRIYAQVIDDITGSVLASSSSLKIEEKGTKTEIATVVGNSIADLLMEKQVKSIVFDRNGYKYHGRVKALAEAIRLKGISF